MLIVNGQVSDGYGNWFQLHMVDGTECTRDYRGRGEFVTHDDGSRWVVLGNPLTDSYLPEYRVGEIDMRWVRINAGYRHAVTQRRTVCSDKWHPDFLDGWRDGVMAKRNGSIDQIIVDSAQVAVFFADGRVK